MMTGSDGISSWWYYKSYKLKKRRKDWDKIIDGCTSKCFGIKYAYC